LLKIGIVTNIDETKALVRVQFQDMDSVISYWLPVLQHKTLKDKQYWMPDIGEHVVCLMDEHGEEGVVLGAIYSDADTVPVSSKDKYHVKFNDGTVIEYDRAVHKLKADIKGDVEIKAAGKVDIDAHQINIKSATVISIEAPALVSIRSVSQVMIQAPSISFKGGSPAEGVFDGSLRINGNLYVEGNINATGSIIDAGGNTNHHSH